MEPDPIQQRADDAGVHVHNLWWADPSGREWCVQVHWQEVGGRMECVGVALRSDAGVPSSPPPEPRPVTTALLRALPLGALVKESRRYLTETYERLAKGKGMPMVTEASGRRRPLGQPHAQRQIQAFGSGGHYHRGPDHYARVAEVYVRAWRDGEPPTKAVAEHWQVSRSAAANWVSRCREKGLLGQTEERRAGGVDGQGDDT